MVTVSSFSILRLGEASGGLDMGQGISVKSAFRVGEALRI
jgi:hypothetical protein